MTVVAPHTPAPVLRQKNVMHTYDPNTAMIPTEAYLIQGAIASCNRTIQEVMQRYIQRMRQRNPEVTMVQAVDMLIVENHKQPFNYPTHMRLKPACPKDLKQWDTEGLLISLWDSIEDEETLFAYDNVFRLLHYQDVYRNAYKIYFESSDSVEIGQGMPDATHKQLDILLRDDF